jgi:hypothetical protein
MRRGSARACPRWTPEPRLATLAGRLAARDELTGASRNGRARRGAEEAAETLQAAGVSAMPVQNGDDPRRPHLAARGGLVTLEHPDRTERHSGNPIRMSRTPLGPPPAPRLGADTEAILTTRPRAHAGRGGGAGGRRRLPVSGPAIRDRAAIVGIGQTAFGESPAARVRHGARGHSAACDDAGVSPRDIDGTVR